MAGDHACEVCGATFTRPQHVGRHMRSHTGDKPYECPHCPDRFARSDLLSRHVNKTHSTDPSAPAPANKKRKPRDSQLFLQHQQHLQSQLREMQEEDELMSMNRMGNGMRMGMGRRQSQGNGNARTESAEAGYSPGSHQGNASPATVTSLSSPPIHPNHLNHRGSRGSLSASSPISLIYANVFAENGAGMMAMAEMPYMGQGVEGLPGAMGAGGVGMGGPGNDPVIAALTAGNLAWDGEESDEEEVGFQQSRRLFHSRMGANGTTGQYTFAPPSGQVPMFNLQAGRVAHSYPHAQPVSAPRAPGGGMIRTAPDMGTSNIPNNYPIESFDLASNPEFINAPPGFDWMQTYSPGLMSMAPVPNSAGLPAAGIHAGPSSNPSTSPIVNVLPVDFNQPGRSPSTSVSPAIANRINHVPMPISQQNMISVAIPGPEQGNMSSPPNSAASPFGEGFSSLMPAVNEEGKIIIAPVVRPLKKRACEQCNASKVKCDSQMPCQKCAMRGIRCTYPIGRKSSKRQRQQPKPPLQPLSAHFPVPHMTGGAQQWAYVNRGGVGNGIYTAQNGQGLQSAAQISPTSGQMGLMQQETPDAAGMYATGANLPIDPGQAYPAYPPGMAGYAGMYRGVEDDAASVVSGYTSSHTGYGSSSRRTSLADSLIGIEDVNGGGLLHIGALNMGVPPQVIEPAAPLNQGPQEYSSWNPHYAQSQTVFSAGRPSFPVFSVEGQGTQRPPSLTDIKQAWRQYSIAQDQPIQTNTPVPIPEPIQRLSPPVRPGLGSRGRSNSMPGARLRADLASASQLLDETPRADAQQTFSFGVNQYAPSPLVISPAIQQESSPLSDTDAMLTLPYGAGIPRRDRGGSGNSSIGMVEDMSGAPLGPAPQSQIPNQMQPQMMSAAPPSNQALIPLPPQLAQNPQARPKMAVFQAMNMPGSLAQRIFKTGGAQTLAPERAPSFLATTPTIESEKAKFRYPANPSPQALGQKFSTMQARPGAKRLPSQILGPDQQKKQTTLDDNPHNNSAFLPQEVMGDLNNSLNALSQRRFSVPGWLGSTNGGGFDTGTFSADYGDTATSFLQAAFPGTIPIPEYTPTPTHANFQFPSVSAA